MRCSEGEIAALIEEQASVDARLAWLLAMALGTTPEFWLNLQATHDLSRARPATSIPRFVS
jgi:plasmid maintenance system antidote protein VapI